MPTIDLLGTTLNVNAQGTTQTVGFTTNIAIVGGYDSANADSSVTAGEAMPVSGEAEAQRLFGENSELARAVSTALPNPVGNIYAVPVPETDSAETFGSSTATSSGTLSNAPVFDPHVHPDHDITVTDVTEGAECTVEVVYDGSPSQPTENNTVRVNVRSGEWVGDEASEYEFSYTYGDYLTAADEAAAQPVRYVACHTEAASVKNDVLSAVNEEAKNGNFKRAVVGARPEIAVGNASSYSPDVASWRMIEVAPARGFDGQDEVRTVSAVAALLAGQPVNADGSITYDDVAGLSDLNTDYRPTEAEQFSQVTAIDRTNTVVGGRTTASEAVFSRIHEVEIVDVVAETALGIANSYKGGGYFGERTRLLEKAFERALNAFAQQRPPLLSDPDGEPYDVDVSPGATDTEVQVRIGIHPAPIMEEITLNLNLGEVVTFGGASA